MWSWLLQNKQWVFSGAGLTLLAVRWWIATKLWPKHRQEVATVEVSTAQVNPNVSPNISPTFAPVITNTIHLPEQRTSEKPQQALVEPSTPKARPNLCVEAIKSTKIALQNGIWTL